MAKITIDTETGGVKTARDIVVEANTGADAGALAPARTLQFNGDLISLSNRLPVTTLPSTPLRVTSVGASAGSNVKNTAGTVYSLSCLNLGTETRYLQLFDKTTAPVANDVPIECFAVYANGGQLIINSTYFTQNGLALANGISWGMSTTPTLYTAAAAAETIFTVRYV